MYIEELRDYINEQIGMFYNTTYDNIAFGFKDIIKMLSNILSGDNPTKEDFTSQYNLKIVTAHEIICEIFIPYSNSYCRETIGILKYNFINPTVYIRETTLIKVEFFINDTYLNTKLEDIKVVASKNIQKILLAKEEEKKENLMLELDTVNRNIEEIHNII